MPNPQSAAPLTDRQGRTMAQRALDCGAERPFDAPEGWRNENLDEPPPPASDWAHEAARGVLYDLSDRRGVKYELAQIDAETRAELVASLAEIIREADRRRSAS